MYLPSEGIGGEVECAERVAVPGDVLAYEVAGPVDLQVQLQVGLLDVYSKILSLMSLDFIRFRSYRRFLR